MSEKNRLTHPTCRRNLCWYSSHWKGPCTYYVIPKGGGAIWPMDLVSMSTFNDQSMSIGCASKLGGQSGFLRHYPLNPISNFSKLQKTIEHVKQWDFSHLDRQTDRTNPITSTPWLNIIFMAFSSSEFAIIEIIFLIFSVDMCLENMIQMVLEIWDTLAGSSYYVCLEHGSLSAYH